MNILLLLIPLSLVLLLAAVAAFVWAVRRGQFDDLDSPAIDILVDEPAPERASRANPDSDGPHLPDTPPSNTARDDDAG